MPAKDNLHDKVVSALVKDGWKITHDPLTIKTGSAKIQIDLGADRIISANKGKDKIAVEVKSFQTFSILHAFHAALGQYLNYKSALREENIQRSMYLAISEVTYKRILKIPFILNRLQEFQVELIVVDSENQKIVAWEK